MGRIKSLLSGDVGKKLYTSHVWSHITDNVDGNRTCVLSLFATPEPCFYDVANGAGPVGPVITGQFGRGSEPILQHQPNPR